MNYQKGNYILTEFGELPIKHVVFDTYQVSGVDGRILWANKTEPIELTEEWLIKFGLKKKTIKSCYWTIKNFDVDLDGWFGFNKMVAPVPLKYVHQLQNLYFALTGNELTIK